MKNDIEIKFVDYAHEKCVVYIGGRPVTSHNHCEFSIGSATDKPIVVGIETARWMWEVHASCVLGASSPEEALFHATMEWRDNHAEVAQ